MFHSLSTLHGLRKLMDIRKMETVDTYEPIGASLREHFESNIYSSHMEGGGESQDREVAGIISDKGANFCNSLLDAEKLLGKTILCVESLHAEHQPVTVGVLLQRMGKKAYGVCESCGELIPKERLEAVPVATKCTGCKEGRKRRP